MSGGPKTTLLNEFRNLLKECDFGKRTPFVYEDFPRQAMLNFNGIAKRGDTRNAAALLKVAMDEKWGNRQLEHVPLLSSMDMTGAFKFVFENDDLRVYFYGGVDVTPVPNCDFPVQIKFEPHSSCICC
jgi:hypothetical protein